MANDFFGSIYNPDVLYCLANLSNDEVFTPPEVVNKMLDMLPQELFSKARKYIRVQFSVGEKMFTMETAFVQGFLSLK